MSPGDRCPRCPPGSWTGSCTVLHHSGLVAETGDCSKVWDGRQRHINQTRLKIRTLLGCVHFTQTDILSHVQLIQTVCEVTYLWTHRYRRVSTCLSLLNKVQLQVVATNLRSCFIVEWQHTTRGHIQKIFNYVNFFKLFYLMWKKHFFCFFSLILKNWKVKKRIYLNLTADEQGKEIFEYNWAVTRNH